MRSLWSPRSIAAGRHLPTQRWRAVSMTMYDIGALHGAPGDLVRRNDVVPGVSTIVVGSPNVTPERSSAAYESE